MRYKLECSAAEGNITLKINAEAIALTKYNIKEVITIIPLSKERTNNLMHDPMKRNEYPYIKNTGKSHVKIYT